MRVRIPLACLALVVASLSAAAFGEGGSSAEEKPKGRFADEEYKAHIAALEKRLPGDGFTIVLEKPFVVVGDGEPLLVRRRAAHVVRWAAEKLKEAFFAEDPLEILDVWLFKDKASYETNAEKLFGSKPTTPFGYYSSRHRALVMNIATGGGTLVHEIVHPFVEANFPDCPPWFNEGLGSLFEQCDEVNGEIRGLTNWRLKGLKEAIRADRLPTIEDLCGYSELAFYGPGRGDHYAMARYLLYRLQETGLLRSYYKRFHAAREDDPTGYDTLVAVLDEKDMKNWQERWEKWVLELHFP